MPTATRPDKLHFTGNDDADALIAQDPFALVMGYSERGALIRDVLNSLRATGSLTVIRSAAI